MRRFHISLITCHVVRTAFDNPFILIYISNGATFVLYVGDSLCQRASTVMVNDVTLETNIYTFDARGIARRFRHSAIFGAIAALVPGEVMRFVNDHDPIPLIAQLRERLWDNLTVTYQQNDTDLTVVDFGIRGAPNT